MSTRVQRAWDALCGRIGGPGYAGVSALREWMMGDLLEVSSKLPAALERSRKSSAWQYLLTEPVGTFAVRLGAWSEFASELGTKPPTYDPATMFEWAQTALWKLCVFIDPDEACDHDEFELELWWSERHGKAAFVCGLGDHWQFRRRSPGGPWDPLVPWSLETDDLLPAAKPLVAEHFPDIELIPETSA